MKRNDRNSISLSPARHRRNHHSSWHVPFCQMSWFWAVVLFFVMIVAVFTTNSHLMKILCVQRVVGDVTNGNEKKSSGVAATKTTRVTSKKAVVKTTATSSPDSFPFRHRGPKLNATFKKALAKKWGQWKQLQDPKAPRPALPCHQFDHCDVPRDKFPANAWQADSEYLKTFLTQAQKLVKRAQEAILAEYGQSKWDLRNKTFAERSLNFQLNHLILNGTVHPPDPKKVAIDNGGWTTTRSFKGLVRRLLHSIVTQDTFTFALGGHSAAAGHGNLFKQSYAMQFHRVMEPVFGRLGVQLNSHNFGKGGLGTAQDSMGMGSLWGKEIDFCMWDAGMLEFRSAQYDLFARQALISGNRVPILWNGFIDVLEDLHNGADVDIGGHGTGLLGIPFTQSVEHANQLPHAVRYLRCTRDRKDLCDDRKYNGVCWVNRSDVIPPVQQGKPGGAMTQHPGFRIHKLTGRVLAFTILMALQEALSRWKKSPNYALPDSAWHVSEYYKNIRNKLSKLTTTACFNETDWPSPRICYIPMKGVSEYTPRAKPDESSIRSIVTDTSYIPKPPENLYSGPDVYNPVLEPPPGEINYLAIVENEDSPARTIARRQLLSSETTTTFQEALESDRPTESKQVSSQQGRRRLSSGALPIGRGWSLHLPVTDAGCNGTIDAECARAPKSGCLLYGHNDGKAGLVFDSLSGWMLMRLKDVKEGLIIIKINTWQYQKRRENTFGQVESSELTEGWTEENNGMDKSKRRKLSSRNNEDFQHRRRLDGSDLVDMAPELCPEFQFDVAINGRVETWSKDEFFQKRVIMTRTFVETWTLVDDPNFAPKGMDVELGIRMRGCKRLNTFKLTHVYWA